MSYTDMDDLDLDADEELGIHLWGGYPYDYDDYYNDDDDDDDLEDEDEDNMNSDSDSDDPIDIEMGYGRRMGCSCCSCSCIPRGPMDVGYLPRPVEKTPHPDYFSDLPAEMIDGILDFCPRITLKKLAQVSHKFYYLTRPHIMNLLRRPVDTCCKCNSKISSSLTEALEKATIRLNTEVLAQLIPQIPMAMYQVLNTVRRRNPLECSEKQTMLVYVAQRADPEHFLVRPTSDTMCALELAANEQNVRVLKVMIDRLPAPPPKEYIQRILSFETRPFKLDPFLYLLEKYPDCKPPESVLRTIFFEASRAFSPDLRVLETLAPLVTNPLFHLLQRDFPEPHRESIILHMTEFCPTSSISLPGPNTTETPLALAAQRRTAFILSHLLSRLSEPLKPFALLLLLNNPHTTPKCLRTLIDYAVTTKQAHIVLDPDALLTSCSFRLLRYIPATLALLEACTLLHTTADTLWNTDVCATIASLRTAGGVVVPWSLRARLVADTKLKPTIKRERMVALGVPKKDQIAVAEKEGDGGARWNQTQRKLIREVWGDGFAKVTAERKVPARRTRAKKMSYRVAGGGKGKGLRSGGKGA